MCKFYSFYIDPESNIYDKFPFESHSETPHPDNSVPLETATDANGNTVIDESQHPLPEWWTEQHMSTVMEHQAKRAAEIEEYGKTKRARQQHAKVLDMLRRMFPDKQIRETVIERAGNGSPETALHHIQHTREERKQVKESEDGIVSLKRRAALVWLARLNDDYIRKECESANYRCSRRTLHLHDIKAAIEATVSDGKPRTVGNWSVANAYRKYGRPEGTYAEVLVSVDRPLQVYRRSF